MRFEGMENITIKVGEKEDVNAYKEVAEALSSTNAMEKEYEKTLKRIEDVKEKGKFREVKTEEVKVTLREFLLKKTKVKELCVVRKHGWIIATAWIDYEDLFCRDMNSWLLDMIVESDEWDFLPIVNENNAEIKVPCHYIDVIDRPKKRRKRNGRTEERVYR